MSQEEAATALVFDGRPAQQGAREFEQAAAKVIDANRRVEQAQDAVVSATERAVAAQGNQQRALERLYRQIDPAYQAQQKLAQGQEVLDRAYQKGSISATEYATRLEQLKQRYGQTAVASQQTASAMNAGIAATKAAAAAQDAAAASAKRLNGFVQQAGYQVGDFASQVATGGNVAAAAGMQLGQLLQSLGPIGAAMGAIVNVGGVAIGMYQKHAEATAEAAKATNLLTAAQRAGLEVTETSSDKARRLRDERNEQAAAAYRAAISERELADALAVSAVMSAKAAMERTKLSNDLYLAQGPGRFLGPAELTRMEYEKKLYENTVQIATETAKKLNEAQGAYENFRTSLNRTGGYSGEELDRLRDRVDGIVSSYDDATQRTVALRQKKEELGEAVKANIITQEKADEILAAYTKHLDENSEAAKRALKEAEKQERQHEKGLRAANDIIDALRNEQDAIGMTERDRFVMNKSLEAERQLRGKLASVEMAETIRQIRYEAGALYDATQAREAKKRADEEAARKAQQLAEQNAKLIPDMFDRAFDRAGDSIVDMVVKGGDALKGLANIGKAVLSSLLTDFIRFGAMNPIKDAVFGTRSPSLWGPTSVSGTGTAAAGGTGGMGMLGTLSNIGSLGSLLGGGGGIGQSIISGASEAVFDLTGSAGLSQGIGLGLDASPWGIIGSLGANLLGLGGKGGIGGMVGGTLGSVAGGALGGTMLGAELGMAAGPIGAVAGAFLGTVLGGMFGPGKSVGPNSAVAIGSGVGNSFGVRNALADNGGSTDAVRQVGASVASTINAALTAAGATNTQERVIPEIQYFEEGNKWFINRGDNNRTEFGDPSSAAAALVSEVLQGILTDGTTKWADGGNPVIAQNIQKALQASIGLPVEQLVANLQLAATDFRTAFDQVGKAQPDQVAAAVASVAQSFVAARDRARQLGLAIDGYAESAERATGRLIDTAIRAARGQGFVDQAMSIRSTFEAVGQQLLSTGQDGSKAVQLYGAQIMALVNSLGDDENAVRNLQILADTMHGVDGVAESFARLRKEQVEVAVATNRQVEALSKLNDWLLRQALGDSSSLSPSAKLTVAQGAFGDAVAAARVSGDIAAATAAADALLSASAAVMVKGTAQYAAQEQWIRASISSLGHALGLPGFAAGGDFGGGLRIVGERGPELEWTGPSRIFSADQTRQILAGAAKPEVPAVTVNVDTGAVVRAIGQSTGELRAEIARLRQEVAELRAEQRRASNLSMVA